MGIGGSHEVKEEEKGFPSKHIFSPVGSPPPLDFFPPTSKERSGARDEGTQGEKCKMLAVAAETDLLVLQ